MNWKKSPEQEQKVDGNEMICKGYKSAFDFHKSNRIWNFGDGIKNNIIATDIINDEQITRESNNKQKISALEKKKEVL